MNISTFLEEIKELFSSLIDIIYPPQCVICGTLQKNRKTFCETCLNDIKFINYSICPTCSEILETNFFDEVRCLKCQDNPILSGIYSLALYEGSISKAIHLLKYQGKTVISEHLGSIIYNSPIDWSIFLEKEVLIIPVPLHIKRLRKRGFNQSLLIANVISRKIGLKVIPNILIRSKETKSQVELSKEERKENIKGAFSLKDKNLLKERNILLIDDVYTTGATILECATILKKEGNVKKVEALTVARAI